MKCEKYSSNSGVPDENAPGLRCPLFVKDCLGFTLVEVMIASGILCMCLFAILALLSSSLSNARLLQKRNTDPRSSIAALLYDQFTHTNAVSAGSGSGDLHDLGLDYDYNWDLDQAGTNGLCELDIVVRDKSHAKSEDMKMQLLIYLPQFQQGLGGGFH